MVTWVDDPVLPGFEGVTIPLPPSDDGVLAATLIRRCAPERTGRALLFVHGFVDYFFHAHVADTWVAQGWDVYALDLRRSGRSLRGGNRPYFVREMREYFAELTLAIQVIAGEEGHRELVLVGHSTGGLMCSLYQHDGPERDAVDALVLNSPFFGFNTGPLNAAALPLVSAIGGAVAHLPIPGVLAANYVQSLHRNFRGVWSFDLRWKPERGFPAYAGWIRAVRDGHAEVARGLDITVPVLVMHSDRSLRTRGWDEQLHTSDGVLDIRHMQAAVGKLGPRAQAAEVPGAVHDIWLSRAAARDVATSAMANWLAEVLPPSGP